MTRKQQLKLRCPTCKQAVTHEAEDFPFCSERCRLIDLGKWASGEYVVSSPLKDTDQGELNKFGETDED